MSKGEKVNNNLPAIGELQEIEKTPIKDWELVKLGDILSLKYGENLPSGKRKDGDIPVYGSNGKIGKHSEAYVNSPGIIVGRKGSIGETSFSEEPFWPIDTTYYISPEETEQNLKYLYYLLNHLKLQRFNAASAIPGLNRDDAYNLKTILPSIHEQRKIASILYKIDSTILKSEKIIKQSKKIMKGLTQILLTKGIGHNRYKKVKLGPKEIEIPEKWEVKKLIDVSDKSKYSFTGGPFGSDLKVKDYKENGEIRIIQLQNIGVGVFYNDYKIFTSQKKADELSSCNIYPGDIIIAKMADPVARACLIPSGESRYLMASDGIRLTVNEKLYDKKFILYSINSRYFRHNAEIHSTGSTRLRISLGDLKQLPIFIPSLSEQKKISGILSIVDNKIEKELKFIGSLYELKKGLMQDLLTGKVRTKDKPITVLEEVKRYG